MILAISDPLSSLAGEYIKKPHKYNIWKMLNLMKGQDYVFEHVNNFNVIFKIYILSK